jgi:hypothetical protein
MQERRNKRLAIIFVALCCITAVIYFVGRADGTVEVEKNLFKDFDLQEIDQVNLESKEDTIILKYNGSRWLVNEQYNADATMIEVLFATLQQAEPTRPVSPSIRDSVRQDLRQRGVRVSLFSSGAMEAAFYAGGNMKKTEAFFSHEQKDDTPYVITIPGYRVYVSGIFELPEKDWKDKLVFGFNWRNFESLEARFPELPGQDFKVSLKDNYFGIEGMASIDTAKLNDFLDDVSLLTTVAFVDKPFFDDSLSKPPPSMIITVRDIGQRAYTLELYQSADPGQTSLGLINGKQWAVFAPQRIGDILRRRAFFME